MPFETVSCTESDLSPKNPILGVLRILGNDSEFTLTVGKTKRDFPGWKVDVITEDLSDRGSVITIKLGAI